MMYAAAEDGGARRFGCGCAPGLPAGEGEGPRLCQEARELKGRQLVALEAYDRARIERRATEVELAIIEEDEREARRRLATHYTGQEDRGECVVLPGDGAASGQEGSSLGPAA